MSFSQISEFEKTGDRPMLSKYGSLQEILNSRATDNEDSGDDDFYNVEQGEQEIALKDKPLLFAVNQITSTIFDEQTLTHTLHSEIHPDLNFYRNSLNLLVGKTGSGKTFSVFREIIKIAFIKDHQYTPLIYVTNKKNDETYLKMKKYFPIPTKIVSLENAFGVLDEISNCKTAYQMIIEGNLQQHIEDDVKAHMFDVLNVNDFETKEIHTIILYDDAIDIFKQKKYSNLRHLIFEGRHPKFTYFLCIQDPKGTDTDLKTNLNALWLFGGLPKYKVRYIANQVSLPCDVNVLIAAYQRLSPRDALVVLIGRNGSMIKIIKANGDEKVIFD